MAEADDHVTPMWKNQYQAEMMPVMQTVLLKKSQSCTTGSNVLLLADPPPPPPPHLHLLSILKIKFGHDYNFENIIDAQTESWLQRKISI